MNSSRPLFPRRRFLAASAAALGLAPLAYLRAQNATSPNDQISIGIVGTGGMGTGNMKSFLGMKDVRVIAVCDVDEKYQTKDCKTFAHYGEMLQLPELDAICIATPDHVHAMVGIAAANAGKDIYGEKPFTWGLAEGRALERALTANKRVWQTGCWQRSTNEFRRFHALIKNNTLGKMSRYECGTPQGFSLQQHIPADKVADAIGKAPPNLDWKSWCGPVTDFPYHPLLHPWNWRWHNTFGGGQLLDWVGHHVDIALWALGLDHTGPVLVEGTGEKVDHPFFDTYGKYNYSGTFDNGVKIEVRSDFMGTKFTGENGWIHVTRGSITASNPDLLRNLPEDYNTRPPGHHENFIQCVRSRQLTVAPAEAAHRAASFGQLGIVAIDTKQPLKWDPKTEKVLDNAEQAAHPRLGSRLPA